MAGPYYSDQFTATTSGTSIDSPSIKVASGVNHGTLRYKRASITFPASITTGEIGHFFKVKSGDRPHFLYLSTLSFTGSAQPADIGLYDADGGVLDIDILGAQEDAATGLDDLTVAIARVDTLASATAQMTKESVGKPFWEVLALGAGSDTEDPLVEYWVSMTMGTESSVTAGGEVVLELYYTSDGN